MQLDSYDYVRAVGDADHASTFDFPSYPKVAQGLCFERAQQASQKPAVLESLKQVAEETGHYLKILVDFCWLHSL